MDQDDREDTTIYEVVVNHEEQYSIWPTEREMPLGWKAVGKSGLKQDCLDYIETVWTDMRPLSLRRQMAALAAEPPPPPPPPSEVTASAPSRTGDDLVDRLSEGEHPVVLSLKQDQIAQELQACLDRGYIHIKFTNTQGGTELGVRLEPDRCDLSQADMANGHGEAHLEGGLTLNAVPVRCIANIDLGTLTGMGQLEPLTS